MKIKYLLVIIAPIFVLPACGGGGSGESEADASIKTGQFIDSAVENVSYKTETQSGKTNANGEYVYREGEVVTFSIGRLNFPPVTAKQTITPIDLAGTDSIYDQQALNIARLLQSLDMDGDTSNGITISGGAESSASEINFNVASSIFENDPAVIDLLANHGGVNTSLISEGTAQAHLIETIGGTNTNNFTFTLYDDFSSGVIDLDLWVPQGGATAGSTLSVVNEALVAYAEKTDATRANEGVWVANARNILVSDKQLFQADFTILESTGDSSNRGQILLGFPYSEVNGVRYSVDAGINFYSNGDIKYWVEIYNNAGLDTSVIEYGALGVVDPDSTNTLTVGIDGDKILFSYNDKAPVLVTVDSSFSSSTAITWAWAGVRAVSKDNGTGSVTVKIDNVKTGSLN